MILSDKNYYYKLVQQPKPINIIFKTGESIDRIRRNRAKELEKLFKKIFDCSSKHNVTIQEIIYAFSKSKITVKKLL